MYYVIGRLVLLDFVFACLWLICLSVSSCPACLPHPTYPHNQKMCCALVNCNYILIGDEEELEQLGLLALFET